LAGGDGLNDLQKKSLFIRTNYGDDSIALVQWLFEAGFRGTVVYVDTGFAASTWQDRKSLGEAHARSLGFEVVHLLAQIPFSEAVIGRASFPSVKFQWCTGLLKGVPFLDWLETVDLKGEGIILLAKRRGSALAHSGLREWIAHCEFHNDRAVWHPLIDVEADERDALLQRAGFMPLGHRSLECEPCVNSTSLDWERMHPEDKKKLQALEAESGCFWTETPVDQSSRSYLDLFYRSCGNPFGCGL